MNNFKDTNHCKGLNRYKKETVTKQNKNKQQNKTKTQTDNFSTVRTASVKRENLPTLDELNTKRILIKDRNVKKTLAVKQRI